MVIEQLAYPLLLLRTAMLRGGCCEWSACFRWWGMLVAKPHPSLVPAWVRRSHTRSWTAYARLNRTEYASLLQRASTVHFDSVQALWSQSPCIDNDSRFSFLEGLQVEIATAVDVA